MPSLDTPSPPVLCPSVFRLPPYSVIFFPLNISSMSVSSRDDSYDNVVEDNPTGGLSDPTCLQFRHRRKKKQLMEHLISLQHSLDLPQIAVVGSQSVGKSSLIESMSTVYMNQDTIQYEPLTFCKITLPRLSKRPDEDWSCEVYLRRLSGGLGEEKFGEPIRAKSDVQERIRRAQLAILNPSISSAEFLKPTCPTPANNEISFSKDLVSVRISGKDVDDLSFVDLPGIIASVRSGGRNEDIAEVKELVLDFIKKPSCLILLVVSCES
ncbi:6009_t:CDS:2, partial [Acaulospora colombiana]